MRSKEVVAITTASFGVTTSILPGGQTTIEGYLGKSTVKHRT